MEIKVPKNCIRVDLEVMPTGAVKFAWWVDGYKVDDEEAGAQYYEPGSLFQICKALDDKGFSVHVDRDGQRGRALSGQPTRIDLIKVGQRWVVSKYPYGWTASTRPVSSDTKPAEFDIGQAVEWLQSHKWTVLEWNLGDRQGYRAYKGKPEPVNDARTIQILRRQYPETQLDLAYYL